MPPLPTDILYFQAASAELWLVIAAIGLLMFGAWKGNAATLTTLRASILALIIAIAFVFTPEVGRSSSFNGMFVSDSFIWYAKLLVLSASAVVLFLTLGLYRDEKDHWRFEFPILMLLAVAGMMMMMSANHFIALYMGLELQSLALYVLATIHRGSLKSSEAGLKYFVLGALASGILLYGISLVYGFSGTLSFDALVSLNADRMINQTPMPLGLTVGLVLVIIGFCFKVSAVPFHMWTPDVYEGAPTPVTTFFASAPKVAGLILFVRVLLEPFGALMDQWQQVIIFASAASMILGALAGLRQTNIKRLLAYSSIGHVGYMLMGVAAGSEEGAYGILVYLTLYVIMSIGAFACVMMMKRKLYGETPHFSEEIAHLAGLSKHFPGRALVIAILMFSMAGIPPLAGFWGKFFIFQAAIDAKLYVLSVIGVLSSVVSAFYYLRIVKLMYFDESQESFATEIRSEITLVAGGAAAFNLLFFIAPAPIFDIAKEAAKVLFL